MTKNDLVAAMAAKTGLTKTACDQALDALSELIIETTTNGDTVRLPKLGTFKAKDRAARAARNPRTGETITVEARRVLTFKRPQALA